MFDSMLKSAHELHARVAPRSVTMLDAAARLAIEAHRGQVRKYTDEPYVVHPFRVAEMVATLFPDVDMIAAAYLHDVLEDTDVSAEELTRHGFRGRCLIYVNELTDVEVEGNRATRKAAARDRLAAATQEAKMIKCADMIDNSCSIVVHDPKFAKVFMTEKAALVKVLGPQWSERWFDKSHRIMWDRAVNIVSSYREAYPEVRS